MRILPVFLCLLALPAWGQERVPGHSTRNYFMAVVAQGYSVRQYEPLIAYADVSGGAGITGELPSSGLIPVIAGSGTIRGGPYVGLAAEAGDGGDIIAVAGPGSTIKLPYSAFGATPGGVGTPVCIGDDSGDAGDGGDLLPHASCNDLALATFPQYLGTIVWRNTSAQFVGVAVTPFDNFYRGLRMWRAADCSNYASTYGALPGDLCVETSGTPPQIYLCSGTVTCYGTGWSLIN